MLGTFFAVLLGTLAGYATSRFRFVGHGDLLFFVLSTRMIPPVAVLVFYLVMYSRLGLIDTKARARSGDDFHQSWPCDLDHEGIFRRRSDRGRKYCDGQWLLASLRIPPPRSAHGEGRGAATAGFCFIFAWNEFSFASILATTSSKPLPVKISAAMGATGMEWTQIFAAGVVLVVPVAIFFCLIRKYLLIGMTFGVLGKTAR